MKRLAVLTGDIIGSSALPAADLDHIMHAIEDVSRTIALWPSAQANAIFSRRGGDSWQIALTPPQVALRVALTIQAHVMSRDAATRIAIATGQGTVPPDGNLNAAHGAAFTNSGRLLTTLPPQVHIADAQGGAAQAAALLADHIAQRWTNTQSRVIAAALPPDPPTQSTIADALGVTASP